MKAALEALYCLSLSKSYCGSCKFQVVRRGCHVAGVDEEARFVVVLFVHWCMMSRTSMSCRQMWQLKSMFAQSAHAPWPHWKDMLRSLSMQMPHTRRPSSGGGGRIGA